MPTPGSLIVTDFSRGWDPTHPDEQLVGANGSPDEQQQAASGAPFRVRDIHDVDFWNGYLNKRNAAVQITTSGSNNVDVTGIFSYSFTSVIGAITTYLMIYAGGFISYFDGTTRSLINGSSLGLTLFGFFESIKNLLFVSTSVLSANTPIISRWWNGSNTNLGFHGARLSPFYLAQMNGGAFGPGNFQSSQITSISGSVITMAASQPASGLYRGKNIWLLYPLQNGIAEPAQVSSFVTSGTAGTANYYVTSITLKAPPKYTAAFYTYVSWNGCTIASSLGGAGAITIAGALTCIRLMAVTALQSGGYRASEMSIDVAVGTTGLISLSNIQMAYGDVSTNPFLTDIGSNATTWYMTVPFDPQLQPTEAFSGLSQIFYRIPDNKGVATDTSTGYNPMPNSTTAFNIQTGRNAATDITLVADTATDAQGYFTGQVDVPYYKFSKAWQNFLVLFGDVWNPSSIWILPFGSPNVIGTQGGLDGAFIQVPEGNDSQVIIAAYVWRGVCYIFKTSSVYALELNGNTSLSPFTVTKLQGNFGPVAPNVIAEGDNALYFLSPSGVCAVIGLTVTLLPEASDVRAKFIGPKSWDLSKMTNSQCAVFPAKKQVWFQVAVASAGDQVLVYDWSRRSFWYNTAPIYSTIATNLSASPAVSYGGGVGGTNAVYQLDVPGAADETPPIDFYWESPWLSLGSPTDWKDSTWLTLAGDQQAAGSTLHVIIYKDFEMKSGPILEFDMSDRLFQVGLYKTLALRFKYIKIVLSNNDPNVPVAVRFLRLDYVNSGAQR